MNNKVLFVDDEPKMSWTDIGGPSEETTTYTRLMAAFVVKSGVDRVAIPWTDQSGPGRDNYKKDPGKRTGSKAGQNIA